jgi:glycosyltransferase involved in cell wall biosynthesis
MNILMLAPEPFFQPRGTPISIYFRLKALSDLGHSVDLVTYHLGEEKSLKNVNIHRTASLFFIKKIRIGPSLTKILLDLLLLIKSARLAMSRSYDLVFSHEEAAWFGVLLARKKKMPHLYDMHSSLPQQLENFRFTRSRLLQRLFLSLEKLVLRNSKSVIVICLDLLNRLRAERAAHKAVLIENFLEFEHRETSEDQIKQIRGSYAPGGEKIVVYAGNFQPYQGISLLLESIGKLKDDPVVFLLVGGSPKHVEKMKKKAKELGIDKKVHFTGQVESSKIPLYIASADALVSPRIYGTNTPLKIYSFLKSGKPLVATNLWTHTQVLNENISVLVKPDPKSLAEGLLFALYKKEALRRSKEAKALAERDFTFAKYKALITQALDKAFETEGGETRP